MFACKRARSPECEDQLPSQSVDLCAKRARMDTEDAMDEMQVDGDAKEVQQEADRHPLAPPAGYFGNTSRDGNEFLADALMHDPQLYAPPSSPTLDATPMQDTDMAQDVPYHAQKAPGLRLDMSSLSTMHSFPDHLVPASHALRTQLSMGALSTTESAYSSGPATPCDIEFDDDAPCNIYRDRSCSAAQPFFNHLGHA